MDGIGDWDPKREALFYVIDREAGGVVAKYKVRFSQKHLCRQPTDLYSAVRLTLTSASIPSMLMMKGMTSS
jgi:hypothetical protein